jgi:hypothetical protein
MFQLFTTPAWFNGWDIIFEAVGLVVALLIAAYSYRMYRVNDENKFAYFSFAFVLVAIGIAAKMFTSSVLYFTPIRDAAAAVLGPIAGPRLRYSALLYRGAFFVQMITMLGAWLLVFFISQKSRARLRKLYEVSQIVLFIYLVVLISIFANFQFVVFYLTSIVILALVVLNYYKNYLNTDGNRNAFRVMLSFMFILFGNIFQLFVFVHSLLYAIGEVLMLIGFITLLVTYMKVRR